MSDNVKSAEDEPDDDSDIEFVMVADLRRAEEAAVSKRFNEFEQKYNSAENSYERFLAFKQELEQSRQQQHQAEMKHARHKRREEFEKRTEEEREYRDAIAELRKELNQALIRIARAIEKSR